MVASEAGGFAPFARDACLLAPALILGPTLGQVEALIDQTAHPITDQRGIDPDLTVIDLTQIPQVLASDPDGVSPRLAMARFIEQQARAA